MQVPLSPNEIGAPTPSLAPNVAWGSDRQGGRAGDFQRELERRSDIQERSRTPEGRSRPTDERNPDVEERREANAAAEPSEKETRQANGADDASHPSDADADKSLGGAYGPHEQVPLEAPTEVVEELAPFGFELSGSQAASTESTAPLDSPLGQPVAEAPRLGSEAVESQNGAAHQSVAPKVPLVDPSAAGHGQSARVDPESLNPSGPALNTGGALTDSGPVGLAGQQPAQAQATSNGKATPENAISPQVSHDQQAQRPSGDSPSDELAAARGAKTEGGDTAVVQTVAATVGAAHRTGPIAKPDKSNFGVSNFAGSSAAQLGESPIAQGSPVQVALGAETAGGGAQASTQDGGQTPPVLTGAETPRAEGLRASATVEPISVPATQSGGAEASGEVPSDRSLSPGTTSPEAASRAQSRASTPPNLAARVLQQVRVHIVKGQTQATLHLVPASLGRMAIQLNVRGGRVVGQIRAESQDTLKTLQKHLPELRATLEQAGLHADEIELQLGFQDQQSTRDEPAQPQTFFATMEHQPSALGNSERQELPADSASRIILPSSESVDTLA